jgi:3-phenylpropionate/cinnamic acid dioxygenase small subunit
MAVLGVDMTADSFAQDCGSRKMATLGHVSVGPAIGYAIHEYYMQEAMLLDQLQYEDWATLLTRDLSYRCPASLFQPGTAGATDIVERDREFLLRHLGSARNHADQAGSALPVRRLITNIFVSSGGSSKEYAVRTYLLITGPRDSAGNSLMVMAERRDLLRRCSYTYQIARREVHVVVPQSQALVGVTIL